MAAMAEPASGGEERRRSLGVGSEPGKPGKPKGGLTHRLMIFYHQHSVKVRVKRWPENINFTKRNSTHAFKKYRDLATLERRGDGGREDGEERLDEPVLNGRKATTSAPAKASSTPAKAPSIATSTFTWTARRAWTARSACRVVVTMRAVTNVWMASLIGPKVGDADRHPDIAYL